LRAGLAVAWENHVPRAWENHPGLSSIPWGSSTARCRSQHLIVRELAFDREPVRAMRAPPHRHHLPGIKNSSSRSYAEIGSDSLRTGLSSVVREFAYMRARPPPPVQHTPGVSCCSVQVARFNCQTALPLSHARRRNRETVRAAKNYTALSPSARNLKFPIRQLRRNRHGQFAHEAASVVREFALHMHFARETYPACPAYRGVKCGSVQVATSDRQTDLAASSSSPSNRETVPAEKCRHRHHLPGI
jgi:hypothetical protein